MAFPSYPYSVADFIDTLLPKWKEAMFDDQRFDENSMLGSGHNIPAEMAVPKWKVSMIFAELTRDESMFLETRIRKLQGQQYSLMVYDPRRRYPALDPTGSILGASTVEINTIGSDGQSISLKGLPAAYAMSIGDKGQISYGTDRNYFFEFSEAGNASGAGITPELQVWPHVPVSIVANDDVNLIKPACKMTIETKSVGRAASQWSTGATLELLEHI